MEKFTVHSGTALPLRYSNVDTDQIIPASYLKRVSRTGFADGLFAAWRDDESFVLNRAEYEGASVLVAGPDFGTGSSREHAVWALLDYGFRVVIGSRFGDIFRGNAGKTGLLVAVVEPDVVERLWDLVEADPAVQVVVDLLEREIRAGGGDPGGGDPGGRDPGGGDPGSGDTAIVAPFEIDDYTRWRLLEGLDDIGITLGHEDLINAYEATRPPHKPVTLH